MTRRIRPSVATAIGRSAAAALIIVLSGFVAPRAAAADGPAGPSRVRWTGDAFLRAEAVRDAPNPMTSDFDRIRLRLRPGIESALGNSGVTAGAGLLASIASDSNDDNMIRIDNFISDEVTLDRAYLRFSGSEIPLAATIGEFASPFTGTEVLWDRDIRFIGASAGYELAPAGRLVAQRVYGGGSIGSQNHEDESIVAAARWEGETAGGFALGAAFWGFSDTAALVAAGYARTNRLAPGGADYLSDFQVVDLTIGWEWLGRRRPFRLRLDLLHNLGADDRRDGADLRIDWGELQARGSWRLRLMLQRVEQDAALAAFGGDEWWFRTDQRGARAGFAVALHERAYVEFSVLGQRRDGLDDWLYRGWIDVVYRF